MAFIPYIGSKGKLTTGIIKKFPEHTCYVEVFAGAANVFFKKQPSKVEVINDINGELVTLYRVVQGHLEEFIRCFKWTLVSRNEFERQMKRQVDTLTDIQRAVRFYYLQKCAFGGKVRGQSFGYSLTSKPKFNLLRIEEELSAVHLRLSNVVVECLPYTDILKRYDKESTLFYLDPPYHGSENYYGKNIFTEADYSILADILGGIKGKFILSLNDTPLIREVFQGFNQESVSVLYTMNKNGNKKANELIISN